jgi:hypothetical protein
MNARPCHHGNLRAALLAEAERTLRDQGINQLSLRDLARLLYAAEAVRERELPLRLTA